MKIQWNGKYQWNGIYLNDEGVEKTFGVWADTFDEAYGHAKEDIPGEIISLERGQEMDRLEIELDPESSGAKALEAARKRSLN
jgi:hypothetical protein